MNSAPVTLPCTSSTTATGGSARAIAVRARRQTVTADRRLMADLKGPVPRARAARRLVRQLVLPARKLREPYHITPGFWPDSVVAGRVTPVHFTCKNNVSWLLGAVIAERRVALVELRLHAAAVAAEG